MILNVLRDNKRLSFSDIARISNFSLPMVSELVKELIAEGYVMHIEQDGLKVGRPANFVKINPVSAYIVGVEVNSQFVNMVVVNMDEEIVAKKTIPVFNLEHKEQFVEKISKTINVLLAELNILKNKLVGVGIAITGMVNTNTGESFTLLNFEEKPTCKVFEEVIGVYTKIDNDVNALTLAEMRFGQAKGKKNIACLYIGYGIGMGFVLNGNLYRGESGFAGEFGHTNVSGNKKLCRCGKKGCLETVASGWALSKIAKERLENGEDSRLLEEYKNYLDKITYDAIIDYALMGDQFAIELIEESGKHIGKNLSDFINLFNPELVIIGSKGAYAGELLLFPIKAEAVKHTLRELYEDTYIVSSHLGKDAAALGAASLIIEEAFNLNSVKVEDYV
ncbi:MAG: ROK family transcriptional regulator [Bacteroidota bacterium]